jgi:hypothetical protein
MLVNKCYSTAVVTKQPSYDKKSPFSKSTEDFIFRTCNLSLKTSVCLLALITFTKL